MRPARVRLVVSKGRWALWVIGSFAGGIGLLGFMVGEASLVAFSIWILLVAVLPSWPPRYDGRRSPGGVTIGTGLGRRLGILAMVGPAFFLWPFIAFHVVGAGAPISWVITGAALVLFLMIAWGIQGRTVLGPSGLEQVRPWPAGRRFIGWESIAEVSIWTWRGARRISVAGRNVRLYVPEVVDGIGDLATLLLERAPPEALRNPGTRERLQQLAQGYNDKPRAPDEGRGARTDERRVQAASRSTGCR